MSEDRVIQALRALAESDRDLMAAPESETLLIHRFRRRQARRRWSWAAAGAAVAAGVAAIVFMTADEPSRPQPRVVAPSMEAPEIVTEPTPAVVVTPRPLRRAGAIASQRRRETVTDFFPWVDSALPFERGQLLRVELPAGVMRSVGLPVNEDRVRDLVQADVLVGEEGLPRAIRFVKSDMQ